MGRIGRILGWAGACRSSIRVTIARRLASISTVTSTSHDYYYNKNMNRVIVVMMVVLFGAAIDCGVGVPILTRIPNGKGAYVVAMQCLCPIDYHGLQCKHHRRVQCYLQTQAITPEYIDQSNFEQQLEITASISADCYIQLDNQNFISFVEYFLRKEVQSQLFEYELQSGKQGGEIIWANDSSLLDANGFVLYQEGYNYTVDENGTRRMSAKDEQAILNGKEKYEFQYKSDFLGFPFTDSHFTIIPHIYKIIGNTNTLPQQTVDFTNYNQYIKQIREKIRKERQAREYIQGLSWSDVLNELNGFSVDKVVKQVQEKAKEVQDMYRMDVVPLVNCSIMVDVREVAEFKMIKGEFKIVETFGAKSTHVVSINSAVVRVPVEVSGVGEATVYNNNFYKPPSRLLYFFLAFLGLGVLYLVFRCYRSWKLGKLLQFKKQVQQQYEQRELG